jgi:membrane peptidoglycan carboxypeptidase
MPLPTDVVRFRRRSRAKGAPSSGRKLFIILAVTALLLSTTVVVAALIFANLTSGLPQVESIESVFRPPYGDAFQPVRIYDRSGEVLLLEILNPAAEERRWVSLDDVSIPDHVFQSTIAVQDTTFWSNGGYDPQILIQHFLSTLLFQADKPSSETITQRLVRASLLPVDDNERSPLAQAFRSALLAAELTRRYPKHQILAWYLNSAYYGHFAYGIDAAALVYYGKHAADLSVAESALLASLPLQPDLNPIDAPGDARARQSDTLDAMVSRGYLSKSEAEAAEKQRLIITNGVGAFDSFASDFALLAWERLADVLSPAAMHRGGLRVISSLDHDLQLQVACVADTHLRRMSGGALSVTEPAADGSACVGAGLLSTLRPSDVGVDHRISDVSVVVMDPINGQVLSMLGSSEGTKPSGSAFMPLVYLTAFAQGYSPSTMVFDVPEPDDALAEGQGVIPPNDDGEYHGPVSMRTALANSYNAAAAWTLQLVGTETVLRTIDPMGLRLARENDFDFGQAVASGEIEVSLLDMTAAYGVMANEGRMAGVQRHTGTSGHGDSALDPIIILRVEDAAQQTIYSTVTQERAVLSPQLAFLMTDVLSDETARWLTFGQPNILEIGRPAGAKTGTLQSQAGNWVVGFTPSRVVGVWVGNDDGRSMQGVQALNGAAPIWQAVLRYATRDLPAEGWVMPPGMSELEVCFPSGLLPTEYCPRVVREVFISGTEPIYYDNLYQPFLVNKETGKLATLFTPWDLVEERVYMIPPPGAAAWADQTDVDKPPSEYDTIYEDATSNPDVRISSPSPFDIVHGKITIRGVAEPEGFSHYRLQYGRGLNPSQWVQIGDDTTVPVSAGVLGRWDTKDLNGLFTLQLLVVQDGGLVSSAAVNVTIDNQPPTLDLLSPESGERFSLPMGEGVLVEVNVYDEMAVERVILYVDDTTMTTLTSPPYAFHWIPAKIGEFEIHGRAYDQAGNMAETPHVDIQVVP